MAIDNASRSGLIEVGLSIFGDRGFDGASVRAIAQAAHTPISAITYHFAGKQGLYLACAQHIADRIASLMSVALTATEVLPAGHDAKLWARDALKLLVSHLINAIVLEEIGAISRFIMREQSEPTEAFSIIYGGMMGKVIGRTTELLNIIADGRLTQLEAQVRALAIMGQVMAFRVARAAVLRTTGWQHIDATEVETIQSVIMTHLNAIADQIEKEPLA